MAPAAEQLYDLVFDPNEANNLAGNPDCYCIAITVLGKPE